jgi:hypothetical protein
MEHISAPIVRVVANTMQKMVEAKKAPPPYPHPPRHPSQERRS